MELLNSAVSSVVPFITNNIIQHAVYPFTAGGNIRALETAMAELRALKEDLNTEIINAERENGTPTNQVKEWLRQVEKIEKEAEEIRHKYGQLCRCVLNISPNFCSIYKVSRSAAKKHVEVKSLCEKKATLEVVTRNLPPLAQEIPVFSSKSPNNLESALVCIKDDAHSNIIGIWGMGGVGKTHLLEHINNELSRDPAFKVVVFVTCSKECSEEKVQDKIIEKLGLSKSNSMEQKQSIIYNFLREKSFVLFLDDLWSRVDLKIIGIPDPMQAVGTCKRKVVLTTRSTEVCGQMEVKREMRVDVLNWEDAWSLFKEKVTEETIDSHPLIQKYAVDVVKELGGLPLALITIGRAMHDKIDPIEWERAVKLLEQARLNDVEFSSENQSVFHTLQFSYDNLKNDALRQCFLHCSLWPEDSQIEKIELVEVWMGLGLIDEKNIQATYDIGQFYIRRLKAVCLLENGHRDDTVKMHDVIRDMALWIANNKKEYTTKWIVLAEHEQPVIEISGDTEKLSSINTPWARNRDSISIKGSSTNLSTLFLTYFGIKDSKTLGLEVSSKLTFLDLSGNSFEAFPIEICNLANLEFLNLSYNRELWSLMPEEFGALTHLKYLLLRETPCTFPDRVLSKLKSLKVLDLSLSWVHGFGYNENFLALQKDLGCLSNFGALGITTSTYDIHEFFRNVKVPIRWLIVSDNIYEKPKKKNYDESCLFFSSFFLRNAHLQSVMSIDIKYMVVECVKFESTSEYRNFCHLERLERLIFDAMPSMKEVLWKNLDPKDVFPRLQYVEFNNCPQLTSISWVVNLRCIRELKITICDSIKQLIRIEEVTNIGLEVSQRSFPFLKSMILWENDKLERISDPIITFPALEFLDVYNCLKLKKLPFMHPPRKLRLIRGQESWWNNIVEMEDDNIKSSLQSFFSKGVFKWVGGRALL
ncbi:Disease resistance protein RPS5 [Rhynchospora pubera]|uniref:Disease resistance protein RPS5 n=1 Tax=Rhynchospora pubera TaxID=906938 RepID=A0AAV8FPU1_9POAL|nr:Disease resistance protein RPS5 [Rhynchospora pubera]